MSRCCSNSVSGISPSPAGVRHVLVPEPVARRQPPREAPTAEPAKPDCCGQPPVPARQKNAREYLAGRSPGVMQG